MREVYAQGLVVNTANPSRSLRKQEWYHARSKKIRCGKKLWVSLETP